MVTDAVWRDVDGDGRLDLVVVGEWMPITVFHNAGRGRARARWRCKGLERSNGWWNRDRRRRLHGDGRVDFVVGNLGLNARLQRDAGRAGDDVREGLRRATGSCEQILATYVGGRELSAPAARRSHSRAARRSRRATSNYKDYARQTITDIFPPAELAGRGDEDGVHVRDRRSRATTATARFTLVPLPREAQLAPGVRHPRRTTSTATGSTDLLLAGNFDGFKPEIGRMAASYGLAAARRRRGRRSRRCAAPESGFCVPGQTRDIQRVRTRDGALYVVARNNDRPLVFRRPAARDSLDGGSRLRSWIIRSSRRSPARRLPSLVASARLRGGRADAGRAALDAELLHAAMEQLTGSWCTTSSARRRRAASTRTRASPPTRRCGRGSRATGRSRVS